MTTTISIAGSSFIEIPDARLQFFEIVAAWSDGLRWWQRDGVVGVADGENAMLDIELMNDMTRSRRLGCGDDVGSGHYSTVWTTCCWCTVISRVNRDLD